MGIAQGKKKQKDILFYGILFVLALVIFLFVGSREPVLFDDSGSYTKVKLIEGVMPIYPLFLLANQWLFGMEGYLQIVIIEQTLLAAVCILLFVREIKTRFQLHYWEGFLLFFLALLPYTTEMPQAMMTQVILTEGLAFSLFYLLMILFLRAVWEKSGKFLAGSFAMALLLAMLRSQLQILFGVCGVLFLYLMWNRCGKKRIRFLIGVTGCVLIGILGVFLTVSLSKRYNAFADDNMPIIRFQDPERYQEILEKQAKKKAEQKESGNVAQVDAAPSQERPVLGAQYISLIFSRGMYEADEADVRLFEDERIRGLFQVLYAAADEEQQRYVYAQKGLWMWKDIVGGIGSVGKTSLYAGTDYYREKYPEYKGADFNALWNQSLQTIGIALLKEHFGRFLYHTLMLLPQAFICTVFFQIKPIYLLCHLVTLFLYLSALALMIWGYADRRVSNQGAEFMALVLGSNVVMVLIISIVFFGQQRYLVYNFGIFYMAYYVLVRKLWNIRIRDYVKRHFPKGE